MIQIYVLHATQGEFLSHPNIFLISFLEERVIRIYVGTWTYSAEISNRL